MRYRGIIALITVVLGCDAPPLETPILSAAEIREQLQKSQGNRPSTVRWRLPIPVQTNGIARAEEALRRFEQWTGGLVQFVRVTSIPENGLVIVEGGGMGPGGEPGCGHVHDGAPSMPSTQFNIRTDESMALKGVYTVHLGSIKCDDSTEGHYRSAVAEHEVAHALGLSGHFPGFVGNEGFSDPRLLAVIATLYANPVGTPYANVKIYGVVP